MKNDSIEVSLQYPGRAAHLASLQTWKPDVRCAIFLLTPSIVTGCAGHIRHAEGMRSHIKECWWHWAVNTQHPGCGLLHKGNQWHLQWDCAYAAGL